MRRLPKLRATLLATVLLAGLAVSCVPETPPPGPDCPAAADCAPATLTSGTTSLSVIFGSGATAANLSISIDPPDAPSFECSGYPKPATAPITEFHFTDGSGDDRVGFMATTVPDTGAPIRVCWAAPYPFDVVGGGTATVQGTKPSTGDPLYVGLLRWCDGDNWPATWQGDPPPNGSASSSSRESDDDDDDVADHWTDQPPCIWDVTGNPSNETVTVTVLTTGADPWRY